MSKLASLAKQRSKRTTGVGLDSGDNKFSSINLLDRLQKKAPTSEQTKPRERNVPKLVAKPIASTSPLVSLNSAKKQSAVTSEPVAIKDLFPEIDYTDPYPDHTIVSADTTDAVRLFGQMQRPFTATEQIKPSNYVYNPAIQYDIYRAFSMPSPDDIVLAAQADAFRQEEAAIQSANLQKGLARMQLGTAPDQFSNARNNLNFYIIGK